MKNFKNIAAMLLVGISSTITFTSHFSLWIA